jgi:hypothetical protein
MRIYQVLQRFAEMMGTSTNPIIDSVSPRGIISGRETTITIRGSGFADGATVELDDVVLSAKYVDANILSALAPALANDGLARGPTWLSCTANLALSPPLAAARSLGCQTTPSKTTQHMVG